MPISTHARHTTSTITTTTTTSLMLDEEGFNWGPWTISERRVIYEYLNSWISEYGLDAFISKTWTQNELVFLADTINEVNTTLEGDAAPQSSSGVQRQIRQLHGGRMGPLAKLARRSTALRIRLAVESKFGGVVLHEERFPDMAIPIPTVVDGVYTIGDGGVVPVPAAEENMRTVKDSNVARGYTEEAREEVNRPINTSDTLNAQKQNKQELVKLSVDWVRLNIGKNGKMVVLEEGAVWESRPTS